MPAPPTFPTKSRPRWSWRSQAFRGGVYQVVAVLAVVLIAWFLVHNTLENMKARGIQSGFDFLLQPAGFDIGESVLPYDSSDSYLKALAVGLSNTLRVALLGIVCTTILGTLLGVGRFSRNALVRGLCASYVDVFRNIPLLLQLLLWYLTLTELLPDTLEPWQWGSAFLSKGGLSVPTPVWEVGHAWGVMGMLIGTGGAWVLHRHRQTDLYANEPAHRSHRFHSKWSVLGWGLSMGVLTWWMGGAPQDINSPRMGEFAVEGGASITPEFLAILLGLTLYTAAFVAEVVRSGIQAVPRGQSEAAAALGLSPEQEMRLVRLPQALRVIIPPLTNQYLNLTKNSSLAVAIGYPDVVSISNTTINQTGRAVECIAMVMLIYLTTSLATSIVMNRYNARAAFQER